MRRALVNRLTSHLAVRKIHRRLAGITGNLYSGEFRTFEDARTSIPPGKPVGYDLPEFAGWYRERLDQIQVEDYPMLFWLSRVLPGVQRVFDFGGHVGLHFYSWRSVLDLPKALRWQVCDVPAVVESGRLLARDRECLSQLSFTVEIQDADGADVFIASGSVQYLEPGFLGRALRRLRVAPRHLLLNKVPVHDTRDFVTVQDTGASFNPYTVRSRDRLNAELSEAGYAQVETWKNPYGCRVALRPDLEVPKYTGEYWTRKDASGADHEPIAKAPWRNRQTQRI